MQLNKTSIRSKFTVREVFLIRPLLHFPHHLMYSLYYTMNKKIDFSI